VSVRRGCAITIKYVVMSRSSAFSSAEVIEEGMRSCGDDDLGICFRRSLMPIRPTRNTRHYTAVSNEYDLFTDMKQ